MYILMSHERPYRGYGQDEISYMAIFKNKPTKEQLFEILKVGDCEEYVEEHLIPELLEFGYNNHYITDPSNTFLTEVDDTILIDNTNGG